MRLVMHLTSLSVILLSSCSSQGKKSTSDSITGKPRVIVSTDIGGTDPDDYQSMIHYLMYADKFQTEGLIASPYGKGRKEHILQVIDLYEKDLPELNKHSDFPNAANLRSVTKQGSIDAAPPKGWDVPSEGSNWIVNMAKADRKEPLWILVWGGLEDVAQALHDAPEIVEKIKVYWIGGPNKKWSVNSYLYIARNFPNLWMIEANSTYRGWFHDSDCRDEFKNDVFFRDKIRGRGAFGTDFSNYYNGLIKMGDTPSVAYLLHGEPDDPQGESWGGSFVHLPYSAFRNYYRNTTLADTVPTYSVVEWIFKITEFGKVNMPEIWIEIDRQRIDGFYDGQGIYKVRFVPKRIGNWKYVVHCDSEKLDRQQGEFVSANPWPGIEHQENIKLNNWWSDRTEEELYTGEFQGARTISKWRNEYLKDWAERFSWLSE